MPSALSRSVRQVQAVASEAKTTAAYRRAGRGGPTVELEAGSAKRRRGMRSCR